MDQEAQISARSDRNLLQDPIEIADKSVTQSDRSLLDSSIRHLDADLTLKYGLKRMKSSELEGSPEQMKAQGDSNGENLEIESFSNLDEKIEDEVLILDGKKVKQAAI